MKLVGRHAHWLPGMPTMRGMRASPILTPAMRGMHTNPAMHANPAMRGMPDMLGMPDKLHEISSIAGNSFY
jgi:hypothetical protein